MIVYVVVAIYDRYSCCPEVVWVFTDEGIAEGVASLSRNDRARYDPVHVESTTIDEVNKLIEEP